MLCGILKRTSVRKFDEMEKWKLLLIASGATFCFIMIFGIVSFPFIFKAIVRDQTSLRKRNLVRKYYLKIPVALDFRVYFFNITNPDEVQRGGVPILKEVGPYCYDSYKEKVNVQDDKEMDTLTYNPYETYYFNASRSGSLTPDDYVTILNPLVVGIINTVIRTNAAFLTTASKAVKFLFNDPKSVYSSVKVRDILFDGVVINCTSKDFAARAACSQLKTQMTSLVERETNIFLFSVFGPRNGSIPTRYTIGRGIKSSRDLGRLTAIDGKTKQNIWSTDDCNQYHGTDGWIFPPFLSKEEGLWLHAHDICRNVHLKYTEDTKYHGVKVRRHLATLGDMSAVEEDKCYCPAPNDCLPKGVFDLTNCLGAPIYATLPHFLEVDEKMLKQVEGMRPNGSKHSLEAVMEPNLGMPVIANKRLQFNLMIQPVKKIPFMTTLPEALHPVFWIEEGIILEGDLLKQLTLIFTLLKAITVGKYLLLTGSIIGLIAGGVLWNQERNRKVIPVKTQSANSSDTTSVSTEVMSKLESKLYKNQQKLVDNKQNIVRH